MPTYSANPNYQDLLKRVSYHGGRIVAFIGSGLSRSAGLPAWDGLRDKVIYDYCEEANTREDAECATIRKKCDTAKSLDSLWNAFDVLESIRGEAAFVQSIRRHLGAAEKKDPPTNYAKIWKVGVHGIVTLNLDGFSQRSFSTLYPSLDLSIFNGIDIKNFSDVISRESNFICNLHGVIPNSSSWVFTTEQRNQLINGKGYKEFFTSCFLGASVIFIGITAEDVAAGGILAGLVDSIGVPTTGDHYWITDRSDGIAANFADRIGLKRIKYDPSLDHKELGSLLDELIKKNFKLPAAKVVVPPGAKSRGFTPLSVSEVINLGDPNQIRIELNKIATNILNKGDSNRFNEYSKFVDEYDQAIHSSWYIPKNGKASFFDYEIVRLITSEGAFGAVYEARDLGGKTYAIKILHEAIRDNAEMQDAFRRGVSSMRILTGRDFPEVVKIEAAWEMPAAIAMEFVDGINLQLAVETHCIDDWSKKLRISRDLANVLLKAHRLPEVVVHRDVRPPNVMLRGFYNRDDEFELVLIDFDLSWHRDAMGKSVQLTPSVHGYLAPEQYEMSSGNTSRSSLVDSFGLATTLFYIITGEHPKFEEPRRSGWEESLLSKFRQQKCDSWLIIPRRLARLVYRGTLLDQSKRIDMTGMVTELTNLVKIYEKGKIHDLRFLVEELALRSEMLRERYDWDDGMRLAHYHGPSGLNIELKGEVGNLVSITVEWRNRGDGRFDTVKKYFQKNETTICSKLRSSSWIVDSSSSFDGLCVRAEKKVALENVDKDQILKLAEDIDYLIQSVNFTAF